MDNISYLYRHSPVRPARPVSHPSGVIPNFWSEAAYPLPIVTSPDAVCWLIVREKHRGEWGPFRGPYRIADSTDAIVAEIEGWHIGRDVAEGALCAVEIDVYVNGLSRRRLAVYQCKQAHVSTAELRPRLGLVVNEYWQNIFTSGDMSVLVEEQ